MLNASSTTSISPPPRNSARRHHWPWTSTLGSPRGTEEAPEASRAILSILGQFSEPHAASFEMDLTPPSLTTSPASPQVKRFDTPPLSNSLSGCPTDSSATSYPSPDLLDYPFKPISPYLVNDTLPVGRDVWNSPESMASNANASLTPSMNSVLPTSDYDTFSNYDPSMTAPFSLDESYSGASVPSTTSHSIMRTTPPVSRPASAATVSSAMEPRVSFSYMQDSLLPSSRIDALPSFGQTFDAHPFSSTSVPPLAFSSTETAFPQPFFGDGGLPLWHEKDLRQQPLEPSNPMSTSSPSTFRQQEARILRKNAARQGRAPRKHTTREEANFQCTVKGCGKFFSRSYNFKSHMDTHDERREYPFPCPLDGCTKKFVRKTDLQRHHQSVHMKERNHKCDFCGRLFARKDTLRRHMEDGCSKRFDLGMMDMGAVANGGRGSAKRQDSAKTGNRTPTITTASRLVSTAVPAAMSGITTLVKKEDTTW